MQRHHHGSHKSGRNSLAWSCPKLPGKIKKHSTCLWVQSDVSFLFCESLEKDMLPSVTSEMRLKKVLCFSTTPSCFHHQIKRDLLSPVCWEQEFTHGLQLTAAAGTWLPLNICLNPTNWLLNVTLFPKIYQKPQNHQKSLPSVLHS